MIFTDCQMWDSRYGGYSLQKSWDMYQAFYPAAKLYLFDLSGYGNTPLKMESKSVFLIAGWSDKVFDVLQAIENGETAVELIRKTEL